MTDREAVQWFENRRAKSGMEGARKMFALAASVFRERIQREEGCECCNRSAPYLAQNRYITLYINTFGGARTLEVETNICPPFSDCSMKDVKFRSAFVIDYCPMCGKKFRED